MDLDNPRWGFIGVAFTLITALAGIIITIVSISDPQNRLIGIIIFLISIAAMPLIYWRFRVVKEIIYQVVSDTQVITIDEEVKDKIQILFKGKPVDDARLVVLEIRFIGNAIKSSDYESPIIINFGEDAQILDLAVLGTIPESIKSNVSFEVISNKALIKPLLLNDKDSITVKVLTSRAKKDVMLEARITGLRWIKSQDEINQKRLAQLEKMQKPSAIVQFCSMIIFLAFCLLYIILSSSTSFFGVAFDRSFANQSIFINIGRTIVFIFFATLILNGLIITQIDRLKKIENAKFKRIEH